MDSALVKMRGWIMDAIVFFERSLNNMHRSLLKFIRCLRAVDACRW